MSLFVQSCLNFFLVRGGFTLEIPKTSSCRSPLQIQKPRVLLIDDDDAFLEFIKNFYLNIGFLPVTSSNAEEALELLFTEEETPFDLVLCDLKLPVKNGLDFLHELKAFNKQTPVILITAHQSIESAVQALKDGAFDYITKPINKNELEVVSQRALKHRLLEQDLNHLKQALEKPRLGLLIGNSPKVRELHQLIEQVASSTASVLITGEAGAGKEMVARSIHARGSRREGPFIPVNCSALPPALLEAELFGHKEGALAGTFEARMGLFEEAQGGTLFLEEIGAMPLPLQMKVLRVLQERKVKRLGENVHCPIDVRVIASTPHDLKSAVRKGSFREDFYYRLNVIPIKVPPLRERRDDVPLLAHFFFKKFNALNGKNLLGFDREAMNKLLRLKWGGNVRELESTIERAVVLASGPTVKEADINVEGNLGNPAETSQIFSEMPPLRELEKHYITYVLEKTGGRKEDAAEILGINRKTLYRKEKEYQLK